MVQKERKETEGCCSVKSPCRQTPPPHLLFSIAGFPHSNRSDWQIYSAILVTDESWNIHQPQAFPNLEPVSCSMSSSNCCFLTWIQISQEAGQVVWYSHLFKNFPEFFVVHTVKGFGIVNKAESVLERKKESEVTQSCVPRTSVRLFICFG